MPIRGKTLSGWGRTISAVAILFFLVLVTVGVSVISRGDDMSVVDDTLISSPDELISDELTGVVDTGSDVNIEFESLIEDNVQVMEGPEQLVIEDLQVGQGEEVVSGNTVTVHYLGTLTNGSKFDSSYDRGEPFVFTVGEGRVIQGWEEGLLGMQVGGKRRLIIPSDMAYGERGAGALIPPNATLVFEIELLGVE